MSCCDILTDSDGESLASTYNTTSVTVALTWDCSVVCYLKAHIQHLSVNCTMLIARCVNSVAGGNFDSGLGELFPPLVTFLPWG